jgi:hypothetical protein
LPVFNENSAFGKTVECWFLKYDEKLKITVFETASTGILGFLLYKERR